MKIKIYYNEPVPGYEHDDISHWKVEGNFLVIESRSGQVQLFNALHIRKVLITS